METRSTYNCNVQRLVYGNGFYLIHSIKFRFKNTFTGRSMPLGRAKENVLPENQYHGLDHNEFVVFREDQVQLRYLVQYED